jgi:hypothetical protein
MCLDASTFFDKSWISSSDEEPATAPVPQYRFPRHWDIGSLFSNPAPPEPEWSRARADVFVLSIETELYASVMYDKRKLIHQHALSQL